MSNYWIKLQEIKGYKTETLIDILDIAESGSESYTGASYKDEFVIMVRSELQARYDDDQIPDRMKLEVLIIITRRT